MQIGHSSALEFGCNGRRRCRLVLQLPPLLPAPLLLPSLLLLHPRPPSETSSIVRFPSGASSALPAEVRSTWWNAGPSVKSTMWKVNAAALPVPFVRSPLRLRLKEQPWPSSSEIVRSTRDASDSLTSSNTTSVDHLRSPPLPPCSITTEMVCLGSLGYVVRHQVVSVGRAGGPGEIRYAHQHANTHFRESLLTRVCGVAPRGQHELCVRVDQSRPGEHIFDMYINTKRMFAHILQFKSSIASLCAQFTTFVAAREP